MRSTHNAHGLAYGSLASARGPLSVSALLATWLHGCVIGPGPADPDTHASLMTTWSLDGQVEPAACPLGSRLWLWSQPAGGTVDDAYLDMLPCPDGIGPAGAQVPARTSPTPHGAYQVTAELRLVDGMRVYLSPAIAVSLPSDTAAHFELLAVDDTAAPE